MEGTAKCPFVWGQLKQGLRGSSVHMPVQISGYRLQSNVYQDECHMGMFHLTMTLKTMHTISLHEPVFYREL